MALVGTTLSRECHGVGDQGELEVVSVSLSFCIFSSWWGVRILILSTIEEYVSVKVSNE